MTLHLNSFHNLWSSIKTLTYFHRGTAIYTFLVCGKETAGIYSRANLMRQPSTYCNESLDVWQWKYAKSCNICLTLSDNSKSRPLLSFSYSYSPFTINDQSIDLLQILHYWLTEIMWPSLSKTVMSTLLQEMWFKRSISNKSTSSKSLATKVSIVIQILFFVAIYCGKLFADTRRKYNHMLKISAKSEGQFWTGRKTANCLYVVYNWHYSFTIA